MKIENPHACIFFVFHFEVSLEYFFPGGQIKVAQNEKQTKKNMANFVCILLLGYFISEEWNRIECYAINIILCKNLQLERTFFDVDKIDGDDVDHYQYVWL